MKKWILTICVIVACLVAAAAGGGYLWFQRMVQRSLPQISGDIHLSGIKDPVEIIRDTYGVPHIYAQNEPDLYFGFGYAMAQDRLWQMEFTRRLGHGRLSEIFGPDFVKADRYFRMLTAAGVKRDMPDAYAPLFQAFTDGINAYLKHHQHRLPIEFTLLRYQPEPWQVDDYIAAVKVITWALSSGWNCDLTAGEILKKVEKDRFNDAFPRWPEHAPLIIHSASEIRSLLASAALDTGVTLDGSIPLPSAGASNNWVVSGKKSVSGKPMLANDTHLPLGNPSFWWEVHLVCPTIDVSGFVATGIPGVPIGQNRRVAWGITNVMVDDVDFYMEKINPQNPRQYWYKDGWEDMAVKVETLRVKGKDPVKVEILLTRHGPIVTEGKPGSNEHPISARWAFTEAMQPVEAGSLLLKARNIQEVQEALRYWEAPGQNFVFADTEGNIGYWCCATLPVRTQGDGLLPVPGWTGEYEWNGYVPFDQRPHLINPETGYIATANNKVITDYPHVITRYWEPTDRIVRIVQMLTAKEKLSVEDFQRMHMDVHCPQAADLTPNIVQVLEKRFPHPEGEKARNILSSWDFHMIQDSPAACIYEMVYRKMMEHTFKDELGKALFQKYLKTSVFPPRAIDVIVKRGDSPWFDDVSTPEKETLQDILALSIEETLTELKGTLGNDVADWKWGEIHTLTFEHVLGKKKPLDLIFNLGPFPVGGNMLTVNKKKYALDQPYHANHGVSMRLIVDLADMDGSLHVLPTGESGQIGSPHYKDQIPLYLNGRYHPAWPNRAAAKGNRQGDLTLRPK